MSFEQDTIRHEQAKDDEINQLMEEFKDFCKRQNLPLQSADELLTKGDLTHYQEQYIIYFLTRWENAEGTILLKQNKTTLCIT